MTRLLASALVLALAWNARAADLSSEGTPTLTFDATLLNNADEFSSDFYRRFTLRHAKAPLQLTPEISKDYFFPTLYGDVTTAVAVFFCSYAKAKALLPDPAMKPVWMGPGRALVAISSYRYNRVLGLPAYNEIAITIPVKVKGKRGYYVASMPVTSLENQIRGVKIWGIPKVVQRIQLSAEGDAYVTRAYDESGRAYLTLRVPREGSRKTIDASMELYSVLGGELVRATTSSRGAYQVTKFPWTLARRTMRPKRAYLELGDSPAAALLKSLAIEPHPYEVRFATGVSSVFDLPEPVGGAR